MRLRVLATATVVVLGSIGTAANAHANGGCVHAVGAIDCGANDQTPGGGAGGGTGGGGRGGGRGAVSAYFWRYVPIDGGGSWGVSLDAAAAAFLAAGGIPAPGGATPPGLPAGAVACGVRQGGVLVDGQVLLAEEVQRSTSAVVLRRFVCVALRGAAPPVNASPTYAEIWRDVAIPMATVNVSPKVTGLTGLPTWFWYDQPTVVQVNVTLNGWTVTGTAKLTRVEWDTGDHQVAAVDGTFDAPVGVSTEHDHAAEHVYETKGRYDLGVVTEWTGRAHITGPFGENTDESIGVFRLDPVARAYDVLEARAALIPTSTS